MNFPQYLWRIGTRYGPLLIRRGNTIDEPIEKCLRKDIHYIDLHRAFPIGILDHCDISDAKRYSKDHNWDWFNE